MIKLVKSIKKLKTIILASSGIDFPSCHIKKSPTKKSVSTYSEIGCQTTALPSPPIMTPNRHREDSCDSVFFGLNDFQNDVHNTISSEKKISTEAAALTKNSTTSVGTSNDISIVNNNKSFQLPDDNAAAAAAITAATAKVCGSKHSFNNNTNCNTSINNNSNHNNSNNITDDVTSKHVGTRELAAAVSGALANPLKDILTELKIISRFTSNLRSIDGKLQCIDEKLMKERLQQSPNWTEEFIKWRTLPDSFFTLDNSKVNVEHSTPLPPGYYAERYNHNNGISGISSIFTPIAESPVLKCDSALNRGFTTKNVSPGDEQRLLAALPNPLHVDLKQAPLSLQEKAIPDGAVSHQNEEHRPVVEEGSPCNPRTDLITDLVEFPDPPVENLTPTSPPVHNTAHPSTNQDNPLCFLLATLALFNLGGAGKKPHQTTENTDIEVKVSEKDVAVDKDKKMATSECKGVKQAINNLKNKLTFKNTKSFNRIGITQQSVRPKTNPDNQPSVRPKVRQQWADKSYDSHENRNKNQRGSIDSLSAHYSDIESESEWGSVRGSNRHQKNRKLKRRSRFNDGPIQLAPEPNYTRNYKNDAPYLPPQRVWNSEPKCYGSQGSNNYQMAPQRDNNHKSNADYLWDYKNDKRQSSRENSPVRPKQINTYSYEISDGEHNVAETVTYEDGWQTYHSVSAKKKSKRLEKLKRQKPNKLEAMKKMIATRFVLTKVSPHMTPEDIEYYLLENFEEIKDVYVRKNAMVKHNHYCTFVFIVNSHEELDIDHIVDWDWPENIICFFAPNDNGGGY